VKRVAEEPFLRRQDIERRIGELAAQIAADYRGRRLLLLAPVGARRRLDDLGDALPLPHERDVLELEPFRPGEAARLRRPPLRSPRRLDVLLVDNVVDTGLSLGFLCRELDAGSPRSLAACCLLDRPHRRLLDDLPLRYVGFVVPDALFAGYGLAHEPALRESPHLYAVGAEV
jgi:hypoxanthine phosphoribosyltransferase